MTTYTVTGNIGTYTGGQVLTTDKEIADYYRTVANEGRDDMIGATDDQVLAIVHSVDGDSEDDEIERVEKLEALPANGELPGDETDTGETSPASRGVAVTATGSMITLRAYRIGDAFHDEMGVILDRVLRAKEDDQKAPIDLYVELLREFPDKLSDDQQNPDGLSYWPVPMSEDGKKEKVKDAAGNMTEITHSVNNPDVYKWSEAGSNYRSSFYRDVFDRTPHGRAIIETLRQCEFKNPKTPVMNNALPTVRHPDGTITTLDMIPVDTSKWKAFKARWTSRQTNGTAKLRRAVSVHLQLTAINEMKDCVAVIIPDGDVDVADGGSPMTTNRPIKVAQRKAGGDSRDWSIGQLLKANVATAEKNGGTFKELVKTLDRPPKQPANAQAAALVGTIPNILKAVEYSQELSSYFDPFSTNGPAHRAELLGTIPTLKGADYRDFNLTFGNLHLFLDQLMATGKMRDDYELFVAEEKANVGKGASLAQRIAARHNATVPPGATGAGNKRTGTTG